MTDTILKSLRELRILMVHPQDAEGETLLQQLNRIGCQVEAAWPYPDEFPPTADAVFISVEQNRLDKFQEICRTEEEILKPTLIAMVDYESPIVLQAVINVDPDAVMTRPVRSFGVMANLVTARQMWIQRQSHRRELKKAQLKMLGMQKINHAKSVLMKVHNISEDEAHIILRDKAMAKRVTIEEVAGSIINANELLQPLRKSG